MVRWNEEEEKILRELWNNPNVSISDIALVLLDRSKDAIKKKAYSMNLGNKPSRESQIDYEYLKKISEVVEI